MEYFHGNKIKLKSLQSGKYLRLIHGGKDCDVGGGGGEYTVFKYDRFEKTLESNKFPGFYLSANRKVNKISGIKGASLNKTRDVSIQFDIIHFDELNEQPKPMQPPQKFKFDISKQYGEESLVVIRSVVNGLMLRVKPEQLGLSEVRGIVSEFATWRIINCGNNLYKLQSCKSSKYLRVSPKSNGQTVDVQGSGGKFTQFRVHLVNNENLVRFESVVYSKQYLATDANGNVYVHDGNNGDDKNCIFEVSLRQHERNLNASGDPSMMMQSHQMWIDVIEQQKTLIDQLQKTVEAQQKTIASQQKIIENLGNNQGKNDMIIYDDGDFEYVHGPGTIKKCEKK